MLEWLIRFTITSPELPELPLPELLEQPGELEACSTACVATALKDDPGPPGVGPTTAAIGSAMLPPTVAVKADRDDIDEYEDGAGSGTTPCSMADGDVADDVDPWKPMTDDAATARQIVMPY